MSLLKTFGTGQARVYVETWETKTGKTKVFVTPSHSGPAERSLAKRIAKAMNEAVIYASTIEVKK